MEMLPPLHELMRDYLGLADDLLKQANPQEPTLERISAAKSLHLDKALQGLALVAKHEMLGLMQGLRAWHLQQLAEFQKPKQNVPESLQARARRVVLDSLYFEPALVILDELSTYAAPGGVLTTLPGQHVLRPDHMTFCTEIKERCFDWLVRMDEIFPPGELNGFRHHIFILVQRSLGAVSRVSLQLVGNTFLAKLKALISPDKGSKAHTDTLRAQIMNLCSGMGQVTLTFSSEEEVRQSATFLEACHPFNFNAPIKKSQIHHTLVEMITKMLGPLVSSGQPLMSERLAGSPQLAYWFNVIDRYKETIWSWMTKHDKHIRVGWMLATVTVCLLDHEKYSAARDQTADFLLRQLKNKEYRGLAVRCLVVLTTSMLVRFGKAQIMPRPELVKLLDKVVRGGSARDAPSLLGIARKGSLNTGEIQDMLRPWITLAPDYTLGVIIELITSEAPECVLAGLITAHNMLSIAPAGAAALIQGTGNTGVAAQTTAVPSRRGQSAYPRGRDVTGVLGGPPVDMLELMRAGYHPLDLLSLGNLAVRFTAALAKPWGTLHAIHLSPSAIILTDQASQRERNHALAQIKWMLRLSTYTKPESWLNLHPLSYLPAYLSHHDLAKTASEVLKEIMRGCPHLRNQVLLGVAAHCASLPDENTRALRDGLAHMKVLTDLWASHVRARSAGEVEERSAHEAGVVDIHRLEGSVWAAGLCSHDETVRDQALQVLSSLRALHQALQLSPAYQPPPAPAPLATHLSNLTGQGLYSSAGNSQANLLAAGLGGAPENLGINVGGPGSHTHNNSMDFGTVTGLRSTSAGGTPVAGNSMPGIVQRNALQGVHSGGTPQIQAHAIRHQRHGSHTSFGSSQDGTPMHDVQGFSGAWGGFTDMMEPGVTYMCDVLEQSGPDLVRQTYWDWGDISDLNSACKDPPGVIGTYQEMLTAPCRDGDAKLRLTRLLIEIAKTMAMVSPLTSAACLQELCSGRLLRLATRDKDTGRMVITQDMADGNRRAEAWRYSGAVAVVIPLALRESIANLLSQPSVISTPTTQVLHPPFVQVASGSNLPGMTHSGSATSLHSAAGAAPPLTTPSQGVPPRPPISSHALSSVGRSLGNAAVPPGISMRDIIRCHVSLVTPGSATPSLQGCSIMALGHAHPSHYDMVLEELQWLMDEVLGARPSKSKGMLLGLILSNEAGEYVNRGSSTAGKTRLEEGKRVQAHVFRLLAQNAPAEIINGHTSQQLLKKRLVEWMHTTLSSLRDARPANDVLWENIQVAYCFASVIKKTAGLLVESLNNPTAMSTKDSVREIHRDASAGPRLSGTLVTARKAMYDLLSTWSSDAAILERDFKQAARQGIKYAVDKVKFDPMEAQSRREDMERELAVWGDAVDHMSRWGMAALLSGPLLDADTRRPAGQVLQWIDRMLKHNAPDARLGSPSASLVASSLHHMSGGQAAGSWPNVAVHMRLLGVTGFVHGPPRVEVGRMALLNLLQSNLDMFPVYLDKSYDAHPVVASTYFQVLCEVHGDHEEKELKPHILVSLILYKMVDPITEVREDARHMLGVLAQRVWGTDLARRPMAMPIASVSGHVPSAHNLGNVTARELNRERDTITRASIANLSAALNQNRSRSSSGGHAGNARIAVHTASAVAAPSTPPAGIQNSISTLSPIPASPPFILALGNAPQTPNSPRTPTTPLPPLPSSHSPFISSRGQPLSTDSLADVAAGADAAAVAGGVGVGGGGGLPVSTWRPADGGAPFSALLDTYQENQRHMSTLLATEHPELSEELCEEMMTRALECQDPTIQQPVLTSLTPWMNNLTITSQWKGTWCERLLKSMYYVTQRHGAALPYEIQALWCTLASLKDNVRHMLLFLVDMGMAAGQQDMASLEGYLAVAKRVCLYLARTHPQFTIDQLQTEISKQVQELDASSIHASYKPPVEFEMLLGRSMASNAGYALTGNHDMLLAGQPGAGNEYIPASWMRSSNDYSPHQSYDLKPAILSGSYEWKAQGAPRTTRSGEGALGAQITPRAPSNTSSRSSNTLSVVDTARGISGNLAGSRKADERAPSSPRGSASNLNSSTGGSAVPGAATELGLNTSVTSGAAVGLTGGGPSESGRGPRDSNTSASSQALNLSANQGAQLVSASGESVHNMTTAAGMTEDGTARQASVFHAPRSTGGGKSLISRPELAICLLSEVAFQCDQEFKGCLPLLLHACCVLIDAESSLVYTHATSLLATLLHSMGAWFKERCEEDGKPADVDQLQQLVCFLQSMRGKRIWACEDTTCHQPNIPSYTSLYTVVQSAVKALNWLDNIQVNWAEQAIDWALHSHSRHVSCRSFQIFRALEPPLDASILTTLLLCLHTCLDVGSDSTSASASVPPRISGSGGGGGIQSIADLGPHAGADTGLEVLHTLHSLVETLNPPSRLVLYPQVFWLGLSLLHSSVVALYNAGLQLLAVYMKHLPLHQSKVLNVLLAAAPGLSGHILLHASAASGKLGRGSDKGGPDNEHEEPDIWALGAALLQIPTHDTTGQRHMPLAVQQLLLRGLQVNETLPGTLNALADLAAVLEVQGVALQGQSMLRDATNTTPSGNDTLSQSQTLAGRGIPPGSTLNSTLPFNGATLPGSGGPGDSLRKHRLLRLDAHQALLGPSQSQLLITCLCTVLHALEANNVSAAQQPNKSPEVLAAQSALARCLTCISRACDAHGFTPMVAPLQQAAHVWADGGQGVPLAYPPHLTKPALSRLLLRQLCAAMAGCFFPRYGPLVIHHCMDSLTHNQLPSKQLAVMQFLQTMFQVLLDDMSISSTATNSHRSSSGGGGVGGASITGERLPMLGHAALALLVNPTMLAPLTDKTSQGTALSIAASDTLTAIISYTAAWQQLNGSSWLPGSGAGDETPGSVSHSWQGALSHAGQPVVMRTLYPASVNTTAAIKRVIDTLGSSAWRGRRATRLLPHLAASHREARASG